LLTARSIIRDEYEADGYDLYVLRRAGNLIPLERKRMALLTRGESWSHHDPGLAGSEALLGVATLEVLGLVLNSRHAMTLGFFV